MKLALAISLTLSVVTLAQELPSDLQPVAAKYKADTTALEMQRDAASTRARQIYIAALDGAEKAATAAGQIAVVAAVTKDREALSRGLMPTDFPLDLPKSLQGPRKVYFDSFARVTAEFAPRQERIDPRGTGGRHLHGVRSSPGAD